MDRIPADYTTAILTIDQMYTADQLALALVPDSFTLMHSAALAVFDLVIQQIDHTDSVAVFCGIGNNGGDGLVLSALLQSHGVSVATIICCAHNRLDTLKGDAASALDFYNMHTDGRLTTLDDLTHDVTTSKDTDNQLSNEPRLPDELNDCSLVIDAIFGAGLSRPLDGQLARLVESINRWRTEQWRTKQCDPQHANLEQQSRTSSCTQSRTISQVKSRKTLSIDLPSGVDGDSGQIDGSAITADHTVTFFRYKPAHWLYPGREQCGQIHLVDIGLPDAVLHEIKPALHTNQPAFWQLAVPVPVYKEHKYDRGHVLVQSGPAHATGAARLSATAALRTGAGLVTVASSTEAVSVNAAHLTEIMQTVVDTIEDFQSSLNDRKYDCILLGPGNGVTESLARKVELALKQCPYVVLDADALTCFSGTGIEKPQRLFALIKSSNAVVVMTPHDGEFKRLFKQLPEVTGLKAKYQQAQAAAEISGAIVVLKGADTIIATPEGLATINADSIPPSAQWLATAGSGDVLAGTIASLLAQYRIKGINSKNHHQDQQNNKPLLDAKQEQAYKRTCYAVWLHMQAAQNIGKGMIASDIPKEYCRIYKSMEFQQESNNS